VASEVFELRPDYRVLVMAAEGLEPGPPDQVSDELLARAETRARTALDGRAPEDVPQVADWRDAYRAFGAKPQRTRPSVEALLRRLDAGLPRIDRLTDTYNAVSIANLVPVGGEDLDRYQGPAELVRADGDEDFGTTAHGEPATEHPRPGEVIWRDDAGVTCRQWNWRQCTRTRITTATTNAVFIIDGLAALGRDGLTAAGTDLASFLIRLSPQAAIASRLITADQPPGAPRLADRTRTGANQLLLRHPADLPGRDRRRPPGQGRALAPPLAHFHPACACTSPASPPSSNTTTTTRKNTAPRRPDAERDGHLQDE
jgi:DNA/RNA-binding domain of Phe-tRNA-synthetase-like protein